MASSSKDPARKYLSHTLAEWAASLSYDHLSPAAVQSAKLFWFDSVGCALGGSQQSDAKILLDHYREMAGLPSSSPSPGNPGEGWGEGPCSTFVSNLRTNPSD